MSPVCETGKVIGIGMTTGAALLVAVGVGVAEAVGVGFAEGGAVGVGVAEGVGGVITTPLFHFNFFPDLTQVNFIPETTDVAPTFVQGAPAFALAAVA